MKFRNGKKEDTEQIKGLWKLSFPEDDDEYLELLLSGIGKAENFVMLEDEGTVLSMACLLPCKLKNNSESCRVFYLYGMCTHPDFRGRGIGHSLLLLAEGYADKLGISGICLFPASEDLYLFYAKVGYELKFYKLFEPLPLNSKLTGSFYDGKLSAHDYNEAREAALSSVSHISYSDEYIEFFLGLCRQKDEDSLLKEFYGDTPEYLAVMRVIRPEAEAMLPSYLGLALD